MVSHERVEAGGRLVAEQQRRIRQQLAGERQTTGFSSWKVEGRRWKQEGLLPGDG